MTGLVSRERTPEHSPESPEVLSPFFRKRNRFSFAADEGRSSANNNSDSFSPTIVSSVYGERVPHSLNRTNDLDPPPYTVFSREKRALVLFPRVVYRLLGDPVPIGSNCRQKGEKRKKEKGKIVVRHWQFTGKLFVFLRWGTRGFPVG